MRMLYAFPEPFPLDRARGVQVAHSVCALAAEGNSVHFAYVPAEGTHEPFSAYGLTQPDTVALAPLSRGLGRPLPLRSNRLFSFRLGRWLKNACRNGKCPRCIIVRHVKLAHELLRKFPGIPLIYEAHEVFAETAPARTREKLHRLESTVLHGAAVVSANSGETARKLINRYHLIRKIFVIPNGVELPQSLPPKPWREAHLHVIYTGSFFKWKGVRDLVDAGQWLPGFRITLVGGEHRQIEELRGHVAAGGAEIAFSGHLPHRRTMAALAGSCIAVLPNRNDPDSAFTSPLKLFEYMASGCAVVASDLQPIREIADENDVIWVKPGAPRALAEAIRKLAAEPETARQMGERLRLKARNYTWGARAKKQVEAIRSVLDA